MKPKCSENMIPLSDLMINPGKIVNRAKEDDFIKVIAQDLLETQNKKQFDLTEVKSKLGIS